MRGKRGLVMGVANDHSIAWGIATRARQRGRGTGLHLSGRGARQARQAAGAEPWLLARLPCDVENIADVDAVFAALAETWGTLDFLVHCIAYSDRDELRGRYADTTRENFQRTLLISAFSFTEAAKRAAALMPNGGSLLTLTFGGATRAMPNYNVMGIAKAALEAGVRYLATDFGPAGIRVNAISAGPVRTLAGAGITDARAMFNYEKLHAPLRRAITIEDVGGAALYLLSDLARCVTGEIHYVDAGYSIIAMPRPERLKLDPQQAERRAAEPMRLYSENSSPFSAPVRLAIYAKSLAIDIVAPPGGLRSAQYHAINPLGTIPCLILDDGARLPESSAIIEYLEEKFPQPRLLPEGAEARANVRLLQRIGELHITAQTVELAQAAPNSEESASRLTRLCAASPTCKPC